MPQEISEKSRKWFNCRRQRANDYLQFDQDVRDYLIRLTCDTPPKEEAVFYDTPAFGLSGTFIGLALFFALIAAPFVKPKLSRFSASEMQPLAEALTQKVVWGALLFSRGQEKSFPSLGPPMPPGDTCRPGMC